MSHLSCTAQPPAAGWLFPSSDVYDFDADAICRELAEMEAEPGTDEFEDALGTYELMSDLDLLARYRDTASYY